MTQLEVSPGEKPTSPEESNELSPAIQATIQEVVQRQLQQFPTTAFGAQFHIGPPPNEFAKRLLPEHISQVLKSEESEDQRQHFTIRFSIVALSIGFLALCALFLYANRVEFLEKILILFTGGAGGFGLGRKFSK